ncbi:hypothetical protein DB30_07529 [Enhygromyxa salina]|uniref:Uncharacterized protein n=1 Tax=Enhygromyxa salina TaxID=215803 RepID=A0A0C2CRL0_9BACT|nr:hypothetical protein [Enhygromyxa salina]KIG13816.1 hypothetical protein DB30_07529 [Enhygromyxa salina]
MSGTETNSAAARLARVIEEAQAAQRRGSWRVAANGYLEAAKLVDPALSTELQAERSCALRMRAADCHIRGGALGHGWVLLRDALERHGVPTPTSSTRALLGSTWRRGRFLLENAGLDGDVEVRETGDRLRMVVLDRAARCLTMVNTALADALRTRHLTEVARFGDSSERCRALASEIAMETRIGGPFDRSVKKLLERCTELAVQTGEPLDEAWRQLGIATYEFSHGRWRHCVEACVAANEIFAQLADTGLDIEHEQARVAALHWFALAWLGELEELHQRLATAIVLAERHKDSLMLLEALTGQPMLVWLAREEHDDVRARTQKLLARQRAVPGAAWPESGYRRQEYRDLMAEVHTGLYRGDVTPAWAALISQWRELESAFYMPMRTLGLEIRVARARVGVALIEQFDRDPVLTRDRLRAQPRLSGDWDRARVLADVTGLLELTQRDNNCVAPALTSLLGAGLSQLQGQLEDAQIKLDAAVREFNSVDMALHRECARYALGELIGGGEGAQLQDQAHAWILARGVVNPRKLVASQAPGLGLA